MVRRETVNDSVFRFVVQAPAGDVWWSASPADSSLSGQESSRSVEHPYPSESTYYTVSLVYSDPGYCPNEVTTFIPGPHTPEREVFDLYVPNVFTSCVGTNSRFLAIGRDVVFFEMLVFNRWGMFLWQSSDINEGWDGKYNGVDCPQGAYAYLVRYSVGSTPQYR